MKSILFLGPYGNLTTLYASILALHPSIIGLNHARDRVPVDATFYDGENVRDKYDNFVKFVVANQERSDTGPAGGSFQKAHTSRTGEMEALENVAHYSSQSPSHFVWKESGFLTSQLRRKVSVKRVLEDIPEAVFIRPVRNPLHWLKTNLIAQHFELYDDTWGRGFMTEAQASSPTALSEWYLRDLQWFLCLKEQYPKRFIIHFETEPLTNITQRIELPFEQQWLHAATDVASAVRHRESDPCLAEVFNHVMLYYAGDVYDRIRKDFISPALS
ncbi:MAG TPA: hypothetical protein EYQ00_09505 [Dehalococcoidia bacterium]|jgi:hypothetical protein|nr:hypothetical protein [Dehalococcoidia bacterium]